VKSCLVADDSPVIRLLARRLLEADGHHVREAADGAKALEACAEAMPDVILMDWRMPVMNGLECMARLRRMPGGTGSRIVFCSVEAAPDMIRQALDSGADEFIMKPFDAEILASKFALAGVR
jgi:two-component system chemotaxis response regulator CheY